MRISLRGKMYAILSTHGLKDSGAPSPALRALTEEPQKAFGLARQIQTEEEEIVMGVWIHEFETDKVYNLDVYKQLSDDPLSGVWMYCSWQNYAGEPWHEKWNEKFKELVGELTPA